MSYLAHSARLNRGIPVQEYREHVFETRRRAQENAAKAGYYATKYGHLLEVVAALAGEFHDMGKLDDDNQAVLNGSVSAQKLPVQHVDAGVAHLLSLGEQWHQLAAFVSYAHHIGLQSFSAEANKGDQFLRDEKTVSLTKERLHQYLDRHRQNLEETDFIAPNNIELPQPQLLLRMALSCMVDADHSDTARHYGEAAQREPYLLRPLERAKALDRYVSSLGNDADDRAKARQAVYETCRDADTKPALYACDSPVGTGKTTAVMAHLLKAAHDKGLRRVFVVLPYTNIISQSVDVYRKALVLDGEKTDEVVVAHHHRAEFSSPDARQFTALWQAPIVVTTAVQFFETLASNQPAALRKLHNLAGSAVFIDEAHAALPAHLWPQTWRWIQKLAQDWGCHFVFGSGSLTRFWELPDFVDPPAKLPELVTGEIRTSLVGNEIQRVMYKHKPNAINVNDLLAWLRGLTGPRLLIVNTVQSAAVIAKAISERDGRDKVEHLSTALTPGDRELTLAYIKGRLARLKYQPDNKALADWTLVATSCVEAGVDLSFRTGLRESASLVSLIQVGGRVNRHQEFGQSEVWTFTLQETDLLRLHPGFKVSSKVLETMFAEGRVTPDDCKEALRREICLSGLKDKIREHEDAKDFPEVRSLFRVIDANTYTVVVNEAIKQRLKKWEKVHWGEIQKHSVQIWGYRIESLKIPQFSQYPDLYEWNLAYDDFLGYMAGVLQVEEFTTKGGVVV
ncbi:MAG: DEAD/DEAH box helicase [Pseudomonadota bacterium]